MEEADDCLSALSLVGHNVAETQTVLWMRMLDRLQGPVRPKLVVVDPRLTPAAREADVWLAIRSGTNVALLNAIQHELIANGWLDRQFVQEHAIGFERIEKTVSQYPPEHAAEICGVPADAIREAARVIGTCGRLVSTCLQCDRASRLSSASSHRPHQCATVAECWRLAQLLADLNCSRMDRVADQAAARASPVLLDAIKEQQAQTVWRRRESNPRPRLYEERVYKRSPGLEFALRLPPDGPPRGLAPL